MDHYATLGVPKNATPDDIKKAFRKLASQHHPDKGGDTAAFQKIQEAYAVLGDPEKRQQYDNPQPQGFPGGFNVHMGGMPGMDINDIFSQMFGQQSPFNRPQRQVFRTHINVSLLDAYKGTNHILQLQTQNGQKIVDIKIPPGIKSGDQMRYDNVLDSGTLLVEFNVLPDLKFDRKNHDLYSNQSISVLDLIVGTNFQFTTISGTTVEVKVKPKTQPYLQLKLPGHGMPIVNTGRFGDQLILLKPYIPDNISNDIIQSILRNRSQ